MKVDLKLKCLIPLMAFTMLLPLLSLGCTTASKSVTIEDSMDSDDDDGEIEDYQLK